MRCMRVCHSFKFLEQSMNKDKHETINVTLLYCCCTVLFLWLQWLAPNPQLEDIMAEKETSLPVVSGSVADYQGTSNASAGSVAAADIINRISRSDNNEQKLELHGEDASKFVYFID